MKILLTILTAFLLTACPLNSPSGETEAIDDVNQKDKATAKTTKKEKTKELKDLGFDDKEVEEKITEWQYCDEESDLYDEIACDELIAEKQAEQAENETDADETKVEKDVKTVKETIVIVTQPTTATTTTQPETTTTTTTTTTQPETTTTTTTTTTTQPETVTPTPTATLALNASTKDFSSKTALNQEETYDFTLSNSGTASATDITFTGLNLPFAVKSNTCGTSLTKDTSCIITVSYTATQTGTHSDTLNIAYNDGVDSQSLNASLSGVIEPLASLALDNTGKDFGSKTALNQEEIFSFTLSNSGTGAASNLAFTGLNAPYSIKTNTCDSSLAVNASCIITVSYTATQTGTHSDTLDIAYNDSIENQSLSISLSGIINPLASLALDNTTKDFGSKTALNQEETFSFTLSNSGTGIASSLAFTGLDAPYAIKTNTCDTSLAKDSNCTITVSYTATQTGTHLDTLDIAYNDGIANQALNISLSGIINPLASLALDNTSKDFGSKTAINQEETFSFTLSNSGTGAASSLAFTGLTAPYTIKTNTCDTSLAKDSNCTITIAYTAIETGTHSDTLDIAYSDGIASQTASISLTGYITPLADISISSSTKDFGSKTALNQEETYSFTLNNTGTGAASSLAFTGLDAPYSIKTNTCDTSLAKDASCVITVAYTATATGTHSDTLDIAYNDGVANQSLNASVTGYITPLASLALDNTSKDFGSSTLYSTQTFNFTLSNSGTGAASSINLTGLASPFEISANSCTSDVDASGSCTFTIRYYPDDIGDHSDTLNIAYSDGTANQSLTVNVLGYVEPNITGISPSSGVANNPLTITGTNFNSQVAVEIGTASCSITSVTATQIVCTLPSNSVGSKVVGVSRNSKESLYSNFTYVANATLSLSASSYDYENVIIQNTSDLTITVSNTGGYQASSISFDSLAAPYSKTGGTCGTTLDAGSSCTAILTYAPTATGTDQDDTLEVNYHDGSQAATSVDLDLSGDAIDRVIQVEASNGITCVLYQAGNIKCVGHGFTGKLGNGIEANSDEFVNVSGITNATQISAGGKSVCARLSDGTVKCWGKPYRPLDDTIYSTPQLIADLSNVVEVKVGVQDIICVRLTDGTVKCWGNGTNGELGGSQNKSTPQTISGITATQIAVGSDHICAIDTAKDVYCWGNNDAKQIATDSTNTDYTSPTQISALSSMTHIDAGTKFTCARNESNEVWCWGYDSNGQMADGNMNNSTDAPPVKIGSPSLPASTAVVTGAAHACALESDKTVSCWGNNSFGQIGDTDFNSISPTVYAVPNITTAIALTASGGYHTCALLENAQVYCWGHNSLGNLGNQDTAHSAIPVQVLDLY